ncbi:hypothetical protein NJ76_25630, partial [Rhodococcus sp. IITR03]
KWPPRSSWRLSSARHRRRSLAVAAEAGRFAESDLPAIVAHHADTTTSGIVVADEAHSVQPGTGAWVGFGTTTAGVSS